MDIYFEIFNQPVSLSNNQGKRSSTFVGHDYLLETLSFSDNHEKILIDLSSASFTSESDNSRTSIDYASKTDQNDGTKLTKAQQRKKYRALKIICNKKKPIIFSKSMPKQVLVNLSF